MIKVCFVCTANICRSPTAEGVFKKRLRAKGYAGRISVDSAGTHGSHIGQRPDRRAQKLARKHGVDISNIKSRMLSHEDFVDFDYLIGMDHFNLETMKKSCPDDHKHKLHLMLDFAPNVPETEVPDPFSGKKEDFIKALTYIEASSIGLLDSIATRFDWTGLHKA